MPEITMLIIADLHHSDTSVSGQIIGPREDGQYGLGGTPDRPLHYRWWTRAVASLTEAALQAESDGVDVMVQMGDWLDRGLSTDGGAAATTIHGEMITAIENFTGDRMNVVGNHQQAVVSFPTQWNGDWTKYDTVAFSANHVTRANPYPNGTTPYAYTFETAGFRCVVLNYETEMSAGQKTWLSGTALNTSLPVLVFGHNNCYSNTAPSTSFSAYNNWEDVSDILEAAGNVQVVFGAHQHTPPTVGGNFYRVNDILYCDLECPVVGPTDGSEPDEEDNVFYEVAIKADAIMGANQMMSDVQITGFRRGINRVDAYLVA